MDRAWAYLAAMVPPDSGMHAAKDKWKRLAAAAAAVKAGSVTAAAASVSGGNGTVSRRWDEEGRTEMLPPQEV